MEIVFGILAAAAVLFASGRVRLDVVALLTLLALMMTGVLSPRDALAGFGDPVVVLVAALLIVGEMLTRTGLAHQLALWLMRTAGDSERRMLVLLMGSAALLGSAMSSTAVVAILIPVVLTVSARTKLNARHLLIPLSFAALISGMLTLIATTPNLVVSAELQAKGLEPLGFFSFTPVGLAILGVGIVYMLLVGRRLLPGGEVAEPKSQAQTMDEIVGSFGLLDRRLRLRIQADSQLAGRTLKEAALSGHGLRVLGIERTQRFGVERIASPPPSVELHAGDVLAAICDTAADTTTLGSLGLESLELRDRDVEAWKQEFGMAVALVLPDASCVGRSLVESGLRTRFGAHVLGLRRAGRLVEPFRDEPLQVGDSLLVSATWSCMARLQSSSDELVVLSAPTEIADVAPARHRAPLALAIVAAMIVLSAAEIVPVVVAVLLAALAAVATGCISMEQSYRSIHWSSIVLIAGMLPVAHALDETGGTDAIVSALLTATGDTGPYVMMSVLFFLTAGLGLVLSNTATAVLVAPVAIQAAIALSVSPRPFCMVVAIAASAAFVTPVSTPVVTLVVEPGGYRFGDFVKVGTPLLILTWLTTLLVVPLVFPL